MITAVKLPTQFETDMCLVLRGSWSLPPGGLFMVFKTDEETDDNVGMMRLSAHWQLAVRSVIEWLKHLSAVASVLEIRTDREPGACELSISLGYYASDGPLTVTDEHIRQLLRIFETHLDETIELASS